MNDGFARNQPMPCTLRVLSIPIQLLGSLCHSTYLSFPVWDEPNSLSNSALVAFLLNRNGQGATMVCLVLTRTPASLAASWKEKARMYRFQRASKSPKRLYAAMRLEDSVTLLISLFGAPDCDGVGNHATTRLISRIMVALVSSLVSTSMIAFMKSAISVACGLSLGDLRRGAKRYKQTGTPRKPRSVMFEIYSRKPPSSIFRVGNETIPQSGQMNASGGSLSPADPAGQRR